MKKRTVALLLTMVLALGCGIGGTLAWLLAKTDPVVNTFTTSDIDIKLEETDPENDNNQTNNKYKMIPGHDISKNPKVTVLANSEDCYLFIQVHEKDGVVADKTTEVAFDEYITYKVNDSQDEWIQLKDSTGADIEGVYYRVVEASDEDQAFGIIGYTDASGAFVEDKVLVNSGVTKEMMEALQVEGATLPTLTFTAYAAQLYKTNISGAVNDGKFYPYEAWDAVKDLQ